MIAGSEAGSVFATSFAGIGRGGGPAQPRSMSFNPAENTLLLQYAAEGGSYELRRIGCLILPQKSVTHRFYRIQGAD